MPAKSKAQFKFMQWVAHNKSAQKKTGLSASKAKEFVQATPSYSKLPAKKTTKK